MECELAELSSVWNCADAKIQTTSSTSEEKKDIRKMCTSLSYSKLKNLYHGFKYTISLEL